MTISIIVAMSENRVIGCAGKLPWHLPADLKHFKALTWGKALIMGSKTFSSIGRALPGRLNIVMSHNSSFVAPACVVVNTVEQAIKAAGNQEIMVIGGAEIYRLFLPLATRLYLTLVKTEVKGDTYMPEIDPNFSQVSCESHEADSSNHLAYSFIYLKNKMV